jgi:glycyl-tRNA synthetase beta subunit
VIKLPNPAANSCDPHFVLKHILEIDPTQQKNIKTAKTNTTRLHYRHLLRGNLSSKLDLRKAQPSPKPDRESSTKHKARTQSTFNESPDKNFKAPHKKRSTNTIKKQQKQNKTTSKREKFKPQSSRHLQSLTQRFPTKLSGCLTEKTAEGVCPVSYRKKPEEFPLACSLPPSLFRSHRQPKGSE